MKQQWAIEDFALSQATLEDVFHTLAETSKQYAFSFRIFFQILPGNKTINQRVKRLIIAVIRES